MLEPIVAPGLQAKLARLSPIARELWHASRTKAAPPERLTMVQWAERFRKVATGARKGDFEFSRQPVFRPIVAACQEPGIFEVVVRKSSQIGYTTSVSLNVIGFHVHQKPSSQMVIFPKDGAAKKFVTEKLEPTIRATPALAACINLDSGGSDNTLSNKGYGDNFASFVGSNSPSNVKSSDMPVVVVEEPDDVSKDVRGQGSAIAMGKSRNKSFPDRLTLIGGTPTIHGLSEIEDELEMSDKRELYVQCPHCEHEQILVWERVKWEKDEAKKHPVFGYHRPESARYYCEACGDLHEEGRWTDAQKNKAVADAVARNAFRPTAPFTGIAGFSVWEIHSAFENVRMADIAFNFLVAHHARETKGDDSKMIEFENGTLGRSYKLRSKGTPEVEALIERGMDYEAWTCPAGGLLVTMGVDVQRGGEQSGEPRLEYVVRAWGIGEESWLVAHDEILGNPLELEVWDELEKLFSKQIRNLGGGSLGISAVSIDSSDGGTSDKVYAFVRKHKRRNVMAIKGDSELTVRQREIFSPPAKSIDTTATDKASRYGLRPYMVGTSKAKDMIMARLQLLGDGPGRFHWYTGAGIEYLNQLTSEVKVPDKNGRARYKKRPGVRNEKLDCEVYAMHAAYKLRIHRMEPIHWLGLEREVRQRSLLSPVETVDTPVALAEPLARSTPPVMQPPAPRPARPSGNNGDGDFRL